MTGKIAARIFMDIANECGIPLSETVKVRLMTLGQDDHLYNIRGINALVVRSAMHSIRPPITK